LAALATMALAGCAGNTAGGLADPDLFFFNGSPDGGSLDFFVDDSSLAAGFDFLEASVSFSKTSAEQRDLSVRQSGSSKEIDNVLATFFKGRHYLICALGLLDPAGENEKRLRIVVADVNRARPAGNKARLIIFHGFHLQAGFQTPNIDFKSPGDNPQFLASDIPVGGFKVLTVDSRDQSFLASRSGKELDYVAKDVFLEDGGIYAVFVLGVEGGAGSLAPRIEFVRLPAL
jgi:hypothetical protein